MSLENLLKIGRLEEHDISAAQVTQLLLAVNRGLKDAGQESVSLETRLDAAYRAITQLCLVALGANGFRLPKSQPGHHQTMIQSLVHSVGLDKDEMRVLDTFRVKRNAIDYTGEDVDEGSVKVCIEAADQLRAHVRDWLQNHKPELLVN
jgi:hypothetical protein